MRTTLITVVLTAALVSGAVFPASALAASAVVPSADCERACLTGLVDRYLAGLLAHDPLRVPWAEHVKFTENNVPMRIGDGLWGKDGKLIQVEALVLKVPYNTPAVWR